MNIDQHLREDVNTIIQNVDAIRKALEQSGGDLKKAYDTLVGMGCHTALVSLQRFKVLVPAVLLTQDSLPHPAVNIPSTIANTVNTKDNNMSTTANTSVNTGANTTTVDALNVVNNAINNGLQAIKEAQLAAIEAINAASTVASTLSIKPHKVIVDTTIPNHYQGWSVSRNKDGYIKMFKRIGDRSLGIHVGREWSQELADAKIAARLQTSSVDSKELLTPC